MKTEAIAFSDIKVGDTIKVTLDADGNATAVVVMNAGAPEAKKMQHRQMTRKMTHPKTTAKLQRQQMTALTLNNKTVDII